jgi:hypothetical protein
VCSLYDADGLYLVDSTQESPLIGFAYDGFPIYGAYAHMNTDGTGPVVRMKSSYNKRNITTRTQYANGTSVTSGPAVNATYPVGYFREDYEYIPTSAATPDYLDEHNGRFCVTAEYPNGIYCYFATVDSNWNSAYPYVVGPTFYGLKTAVKVPSITEPVTLYTSTAVNENANENDYPNVFSVPVSDLVVIQMNGLVREDMHISLYDVTGKLIDQTILYQGSTIAYFDTRRLYSGGYIVRVSSGAKSFSKKIVLMK